MTRYRRLPNQLFIYTVLIGGSIVMMYPLVFMALASFTTTAEYTRTTWIPVPGAFNLEQYRFLFFAARQVPLWIVNTLIRIVWYILIPGVVAVLCGYVFARLRFRGRDAVFMLLLTSLLMPPIVYQIPTFVMMARWPLAGGNDLFGQGGSGFVNAWPALLLPGLVNAANIFLVRQAFYSIPVDFEEAARVDGANTLQILTRVYLPILLPIITVIIIFTVVEKWNEYQWPLIVASSNQQVWPMALGFQRLIASTVLVPGMAQYNYPFYFATAVVAILPMIILFVFLQRYFVEGVAGFAVK